MDAWGRRGREGGREERRGEGGGEVEGGRRERDEGERKESEDEHLERERVTYYSSLHFSLIGLQSLSDLHCRETLAYKMTLVYVLTLLTLSGYFTQALGNPLAASKTYITW